MSVFKDSVEALSQAIEARYAASAVFKAKMFVPEVRQGNLAWEGDVCSFHMIYNPKRTGASREQIASWRLAGPSAEALDEAEQRGAKLRKQMLAKDFRSPEIRRRAKLAYAWSSPIPGSDQRQLNVVLHEGAVHSAADAVKAAMGKEK